MYASYDYPIVVISNKKYRGELSIYDDHLYVWGYGSLFDYLFSTYVASFGKKYTWLIYFKEIDLNKIVQNNELIYISVTSDKNSFSLNLKAKSRDEASQLVDKLKQQINNYYRKIEVEKSLKAKYQVGDVENIHYNDFEKLMEELFEQMGNTVHRIGGSGDGGVDLQGKNNLNGEKVIVQCKRYKGKVGVGALRDFYGALIHTKSDKGYFVTTGEFTNGVYKWIENKPIELIDRKKLKELLLVYYK